MPAGTLARRRALRAARPGARHRARARRPDRRPRSTAGADARRPHRRGRAVGRGASPSRRAETTRSTGSSRTASARALGCELDLAPFLGVMGMPPPEPGVHSTVPPRRWGGNIDCKELVAGTTLYLPIPVDGALFSAGDGHAARVTARCRGTAIEAPASAQLTLDVRDDPALEWPVARIEGAWLTFGFDERLGIAAQIAIEGMVGADGAGARLERRRCARARERCGRPPRDAGRERAVGVHAVLRDDAIRSE